MHPDLPILFVAGLEMETMILPVIAADIADRPEAAE